MSRKKTIKEDNALEGVLFGIITQLKDYQLPWFINKNLNFDLRKMEDIEIIHRKKNKIALFSIFRHEDELDKCIVYVISNKHLGEYLVPELKQADFILLIKGDVSNERRDQLLSVLKNIPHIQMVISVDHSKLKSGNNLLFE